MDLLQELTTQIKSSGDVMAQFPGGCLTYQADPNNQALPVLILNPISDGDGGGASDPGFNTSRDYTVVESIQVAVYASTPEKAKELGLLLEERFFTAPMTLPSGEYVMAWEWVADRRHKDLHPDADANPVYHYSVDFDARVQRKRT